MDEVSTIETTSIAPYSLAIGKGDNACIAGRGAVDLEPGEGIAVEAREQAYRTVERVGGIRAAADASPDTAVKSTVSVQVQGTDNDDANDGAPEEYRNVLCRARSEQVEARPVDSGVDIERLATKDQ